MLRIRSTLTVVFSLFVISCSHQAIIPEAKNIKIQREDVSEKCRSLGPVQGSVVTTKGKIEEAIEDMKLEAARKGANTVQMGPTSAFGKNVSGTAFICP